MNGFDITPAHLEQVRRWVDAGRRIHGDRIDWEQRGNWALWKAWSTYRPGKPRTHWHLARALWNARRDALKQSRRHRATDPEVVAALIDARWSYAA